MIKKICIPVDGSANGNIALDYGIYLARLIDASLQGIHVIDAGLIQAPLITDITCSGGIGACDGIYEIVETSLQKKAELIINDFRERCGKAGISAEIKKATGIVDESIIEQAENSDLILMAKKGEHFHLPEGGILGTVAEAVIRKSGKPVMVTPEKFLEIESMGMAYDGSEPAKKALHLCLALAVQAAWPITALIVTADSAQAARLTSQIEEATEDKAADMDFVILQGREDEKIIEFIKQGSVELMVMGAYGHNRLRELLLGSTTSYIISKSPIPVLLTR